MKIYQNNELIANFKRVGFCLTYADKGDFTEVGERWSLENAMGELIDDIIIDSKIKALDSSMLEAIFKHYKESLELGREKLVAIAENPNELTEQEIVFYISTKEQSPQ